MKKYILLSCLALGLLCMGNLQSAQARPDPATLAERCIDRVEDIAQRWVTTIDAHKTRIVAKINQLLEQGKTRRAEQLATRAIRFIRTMERVSVNRIRFTCRLYAGYLTRVGWPDLAAEVIAAGDAASERINSAVADAIEDIRAALAGDTSEEGGEEGGDTGGDPGGGDYE